MGLLYPTLVGVAAWLAILRVLRVRAHLRTRSRRMPLRLAAAAAVLVAALALVARTAPEAWRGLAWAFALATLCLATASAAVHLRWPRVLPPLVGLAALVVLFSVLRPFPWPDRTWGGAVVGASAAFLACALLTLVAEHATEGRPMVRREYGLLLIAWLAIAAVAWWVWWPIGLLTAGGIAIASPVVALAFAMAPSDRQVVRRVAPNNVR